MIHTNRVITSLVLFKAIGTPAIYCSPCIVIARYVQVWHIFKSENNYFGLIFKLLTVLGLKVLKLGHRHLQNIFYLNILSVIISVVCDEYLRPY